MLLGTGEMYLDSILSDLRAIWALLDIKVSEPVVRFTGTAIEMSMVQFAVTIPNGLTRVAGPLEKGLAEAIEAGDVDMRLPARRLARLLTERFDWDAQAITQGFQWGTREAPLWTSPCSSDVKSRILGATLAHNQLQPGGGGGGQIILTA